MTTEHFPRHVQVVLVTVPDRAVGLSLARTLIQERLAACASLVPGLRSVYRWQGRVEEENEELMVLKTQAGLADRLARRVTELHPHQVPEVLALPVSGGSPDYLAWVLAETGDKEQ